MVQHKVKQKVSLPKGTKEKGKIKKAKPQGPKRGHNLSIAPKKAAAVKQATVSAEVTKIINKKNEELVKERADRGVGRVTTKTS